MFLRRAAAALLAWLAVASAVSAGGVESSSDGSTSLGDAAYERAWQAYERQDTHASEAAFRESVAFDPTNFEARFMLGSVLYERPDYAAAELVFRETVARHPNSANAHFALGKLLTISKDIDGSELHLRKSVALDPKHVESRVMLGQFLFYERSDHDAAEPHFRQTVVLALKDAEARYLLALMLAHQNRVDVAERELRVGIELDPSHWRRKDVEHFLSWTKSLSDNVLARGVSKGALLEGQDIDALEKKLRQTITRDPKNVQARVELGNLLNSRLNFDAAEPQLREAIALDPTNAAAHFLLGNLLAEGREDYDAAEPFLSGRGISTSRPRRRRDPPPRETSTEEPRRYTGRHAVFMAGRIRVAHDALQKLRPIVRRRYGTRTNVTVDWFFHLWYNSSSLCLRGNQPLGRSGPEFRQNSDSMFRNTPAPRCAQRKCILKAP